MTLNVHVAKDERSMSLTSKPRRYKNNNSQKVAKTKNGDPRHGKHWSEIVFMIEKY